MTQLAGKTEWVEVDGIRRLVVEGAPIPPGIGLEDQGSGDDVDPRTLTRPVVDEDASKPMAGATAGDPAGGVSTANVEAVGSGRKRSGRQQGSGSGGGAAES